MEKLDTNTQKKKRLSGKKFLELSLPQDLSPPNHRVSKGDKSCGNCSNFYLKVGWEGSGECQLYDYRTDEDLLCDSYQTSQPSSDEQ